MRSRASNDCVMIEREGLVTRSAAQIGAPKKALSRHMGEVVRRGLDDGLVVGGMVGS